VGSNPTQDMDVWYVYVFILCLCCPVFRLRICDKLITRPKSPTVCKMITKLKNQGPRVLYSPWGKKCPFYAGNSLPFHALSVQERTDFT
jgi:hypothetical protein